MINTEEQPGAGSPVVYMKPWPHHETFTQKQTHFFRLPQTDELQNRPLKELIHQNKQFIKINTKLQTGLVKCSRLHLNAREMKSSQRDWLWLMNAGQYVVTTLI